jgi:uncharacterized protein (TIGR04255 family)
MANIETFPNAPIIEAILSIEVSYLTELATPADSFYQTVRDRLPIREEINSGGDGGYRFTSADALQVLQVTRRSFSFHRLRPYTDWVRFSSEAHGIWREYLGHFTPEKVRGASLRYLNRIDIPTPFRDLSEYVSLSLNLPDGIAPGFSEYLVRLSLTDKSIPAVAYVTQRAEHELASGALSLLFDIDVRSEFEIPIRDESVWGLMEDLRDYKNRLFFSSITDAAKELFR